MFDTLNRLDALVAEFELRLYPVRIASGSAGGKMNIQLNREELYRLAVDILREAVKLGENEELAVKVKARVRAMHLATQASFAAECILRDYQRDEIIALVNEVVKTNESLKEELRALRERAEGTAPPN